MTSLSDIVADAGAYAENNKTTVAIVGGATLFAGLSLYMKRSSRSKPGTFDIGSGSVDRSKVETEVRVAEDTYNQGYVWTDSHVVSIICR